MPETLKTFDHIIDAVNYVRVNGGRAICDNGIPRMFCIKSWMESGDFFSWGVKIIAPKNESFLIVEK